MEEVWKQAYTGGVICPGYEVSNLGNVRSFRKQTRISGVKGTVAYIGTEPRLLKRISLSTGYYGVNLVVGTQIKQRGIAPLVLEAFVGPKPDGMEACHGPLGAKCDQIDNLQWGTKSKNHGVDRLRDGTDVRGQKHGNSKLSNEQVAEIKRRLSLGGRIQAILSREFGVGRTTIAAIKQGRNWSWMKPESESQCHV